MVNTIKTICICKLEMVLSYRGGFRDHFATKIIDLAQTVKNLQQFSRGKSLILWGTKWSKMAIFTYKSMNNSKSLRDMVLKPILK